MHRLTERRLGVMTVAEKIHASAPSLDRTAERTAMVAQFPRKRSQPRTLSGFDDKMAAAEARKRFKPFNELLILANIFHHSARFS